MNKFILVAMNRKNHTQKELEANLDAADAATYAYSAAAAAAYAAAYADADAEYWINKYFERTGEDKQLYTNEIERINNMKTVTCKITEPVFTQAMADNGELPKAGMLCLINFPDIDNAWYEYTIDFIGKHMVVATCKEVAERTSHIDNVYFKHIDTRTDKEKAIDEMYDEMNRRFDLPKSDSEHMCNDDTQVGVEFLVAYLGDYKWVGE
jgi:hypothetical protein